MFKALILGIVQGITEFLPVSSSGHVTVFESLLNYKSEGFAAAIHFATFLAAIIYFHKDILAILKSFTNWNDKGEEISKIRDLGIKLVIATIPVVILAYILDKSGVFMNIGESLVGIGIASIFFGILLYFADQKSKNSVNATTEVSWKNSLLISLSQLIAAALPGASRSGVTLTSSFFVNLNREFATKFVFLLSIPVTGIAAANELLIKHSISFNSEFAVAFTAAFISGILAIHFLIKLIQKFSLKWISGYRVLFGIAVIIYGIS
jgi:undecaprenyl-diphosphatase